MATVNAAMNQSFVHSEPDRHPQLDRKQVGAIRRINGLSRQPRGDWSGMMGPTPLGIDFGAYQFQLAYAAYALALAHYHRLPAAPGVFKPIFERLITKVLEVEVWWYWHDVSRGGGGLMAPESEGWIDPIAKENIMYSAYVQSMTVLYNVLFNDARYTEKGALTVEYRSPTWGPIEGFKYEYDQNSINDLIYWQMVESGYLGVACEPSCVFQICNQPAIFAFRLHDMLSGGSVAEEAAQGYIRAWEDVGGVLDEQGHYQTVRALHLGVTVPSKDLWSDAWAGALMHAWNPEFVKANYPSQRDRWLIRGDDGTLSVRFQEQDPEHFVPFGFGWMAVWASEVGDTETVEGLLAHADRYMNPKWVDGAFFYPRNDQPFDEAGNLTACHPHQGNVLLAYARLNVPDGLRLFYENGWDKAHFDEPALTDVDYGVDVYRAVYDADARALLFDVARAEAEAAGEIQISRVFDRGDWTLARNGEEIARGSTRSLSAAAAGIVIEQVGDKLKLTISDPEVSTYQLIWED